MKRLDDGEVVVPCARSAAISPRARQCLADCENVLEFLATIYRNVIGIDGGYATGVQPRCKSRCGMSSLQCDQHQVFSPGKLHRIDGGHQHQARQRLRLTKTPYCSAMSLWRAAATDQALANALCRYSSKLVSPRTESSGIVKPLSILRRVILAYDTAAAAENPSARNASSS